MNEVKQNSTRRFKIFVTDASDLTAGLTGLVSGDFTVYLTKDNGTEQTVSVTVTERGRGFYEVEPLAAHRDTLGENAWLFTATGAVDCPRLELVVAKDASDLSSEIAGRAAPGDNMTTSAFTPASLTDIEVAAKAGVWEDVDPLTLATSSEVMAAQNNINGHTTTEVGNVPGNVWTHPTRTLTAFGFSVTVGTNNDKTGYALTSGERSSIAGAVDLALINQVDGADLISAIADQIADDWVAGDASPLAIVAALKADSEWVQLIADAAASATSAANAEADAATAATQATAAAGSSASALTNTNTLLVRASTARMSKLDRDLAHAADAAIYQADVSSLASSAELPPDFVNMTVNLDGTVEVSSTSQTAIAGEVQTTIETPGSMLDGIRAVLAGITSLAHWLRALTRTDAANATAKTEINAGGGTYDESLHSLQADKVVTKASIRNGLNGRWTDELNESFDLTVSDTP